ncbi:choline-binding transcriptional repressor BetI [Arenibacterium halophilum]|uniref:HTH-type transcriptional regulator BetI n=1 Tax=Arenibacterium halophilum TaxID=2583821 RepID=A0ABY2XEI9_9RHOB|nr:transcriptional regulator BetI [Arenibacterium halophilum]TMV14892.1 transcriptional regulator BetI [Arenibacterium halophilum]
MPKVGMEPIRREALVKATIAEIGAVGSLDVTVSQIARRAGMSSALAHHYFGGKEQIFLAAMRRILGDFGAEARAGLVMAHPEGRAAAIVRACFAPSCFTPESTTAWMTFYVLAQTNPEALRLWRIYQRRMRSNLTHALRPICRAPEAVADTMVALIDGLYIRAALSDPETPERATVHALDVLAKLTGDGV